MKKELKKLAIASIASASLFAGLSIPANAVPFVDAQDTNIRLFVDAWRPVLSGNIRGNSWVSTRNANSQAVEARVVITNRNSNGTLHSTTTGVWVRRAAASGTLANNTEHQSGTVTGSTRFGTVRGEGRRRATSTGAWSTPLTHNARTW